MPSTTIHAAFAQYCYVDLDVDHYRQRLAVAAAFVSATDSRYGLSSDDLRQLGGSEVARLQEMIEGDHEWSTKNAACRGIRVRPPDAGNRLVVKLYWDVAPLACQNFATLCANGSMVLPGERKAKPAPVGESGKPLTYRGSLVHRIVPGFVVQGGDFVFGNGSGGESVLGKKAFKDERPGLTLKHDRRGVLSMGNSGKNSNTSQFFITFAAAPQCDGKHVVFGEVVSGFEVLDHVEGFGSKDGEPTAPITITDCGIFTPLQTAGAGYWYDKPDEEAFSGVSPVFMVRPRVAVLGPSAVSLQRFQRAIGSYATIVQAVRADQYEEVDQKISSRIQELLASFAVDVVLVAPAYKDVVQSLELPRDWRGVAVESVLLVSKPLEALCAIWQRSWMRSVEAWQLDGAPL